MILNFIIIILIIIIFIKNKNKLKKEDFTNSNNNKNNIWLYWEEMPNTKKYGYLHLCYKTIQKHCKDCNVHLLNEKTVYNYLPELKNDPNLFNYCSIPQKADYIRLFLLYKYGGIWLDSDVIVFKSLYELFEVLKNYDFIGFGCHFKNCNINTVGFPNPANWVLGSKKEGILIKRCFNKARDILINNPYLLKKKYHIIGRELLWEQIDYLLKNNPNWSYYHFDSKCIERDNKGDKLINERHISNEEIDSKCKNKYIFIPIYNTAPGFPEWFKNMNEEDLLKKNILFSKLIKFSLKI